MHKNGHKWTEVDTNGPYGTKQTEWEQGGLNRTEVDRTRPNGQIRTKVDIWIEYDQCGPNRTKVDRI